MSSELIEMDENEHDQDIYLTMSAEISALHGWTEYIEENGLKRQYMFWANKNNKNETNKNNKKT